MPFWSITDKLNGVAKATISKINTVEAANLYCLNGCTGYYEDVDLTTFTETDTAGDLTVLANKSSYDTMRRDSE